MLAFIVAISTLQLSPVLLKELWLVMARRKKKPAVPAGRRNTISGIGTRASQHLAGKRKTKELASSGDSMESANSRPAPGAGTATLPETLSVTDEQDAAGSLQTGPPGGGNVRHRVDRVRRPVSDKWAAQAHSNGFGPVRKRCLNGDNQ